jgi:hypothetical protein
MSTNTDYQLIYDASNIGFSAFKDVISKLVIENKQNIIVIHLEALLLNLFQNSYKKVDDVLEYIYKILFNEKQKIWCNTINKTISKTVDVPNDKRWIWLRKKMVEDPIFTTMILNNETFLSKQILITDFIRFMEETLDERKLVEFYEQMRKLMYMAFSKCKYNLINILLLNGISQYCVESQNVSNNHLTYLEASKGENNSKEYISTKGNNSKEYISTKGNNSKEYISTKGNNSKEYISGLFVMPCFDRNALSRNLVNRCMMHGLDINTFVSWKGKETNLLFYFIETYNDSGVESLVVSKQVEYLNDGEKKLLGVNLNMVHPITGFTPLMSALIEFNKITTNNEHLKLKTIILTLINAETDLHFTTSSGIDILSVANRNKDPDILKLIKEKIKIELEYNFTQ